MPGGANAELFLALCLVAGYVFHHHCHFAFFRTLRYSGYRIVFLSAAWGVLFAFLGRATAYWVGLTATGEEIARHWRQVFPSPEFPYAGSAVAAIGWSVLFILAMNLIWSRERAKRQAVAKDQDSMLALLISAVESLGRRRTSGDFGDVREAQAVLLALRNRKVYAGLIRSVSSVVRKEATIEVLPIASGFRREKDLAVELDFSYIRLWGPGGPFEDSPQALVKAIPLEEVVTLNRFDKEVYAKHFSQESVQTEEVRQAQPPPGMNGRGSLLLLLGVAVVALGSLVRSSGSAGRERQRSGP